MTFMIFAYNPTFVKLEDLKMLRDWLDKFNCEVFFIPHYNNNEDSIYCVKAGNVIQDVDVNVKA